MKLYGTFATTTSFASALAPNAKLQTQISVNRTVEYCFLTSVDVQNKESNAEASRSERSA